MATITLPGLADLVTESRETGLRLRVAWAIGRRPLLAIGATTLVGLTSLAEHDDRIGPFLERIGVERAGLPAVTAIARLPVSLVLSSPALPSWGALLQVFVFVALGELLCGWRKTVVVGFTAHAAATLSARVMIAMHSGPLSLPQRYLHIRDTGPSAAVVGIAIYLMVRFRTPWLLAGAVGAMVLELAVLPNLAGREHIVAILVGGAIAAYERGRPRKPSDHEPPCRIENASTAA